MSRIASPFGLRRLDREGQGDAQHFWLCEWVRHVLNDGVGQLAFDVLGDARRVDEAGDGFGVKLVLPLLVVARGENLPVRVLVLRAAVQSAEGGVQLIAASPDELLVILSLATGLDLTQLANTRRFAERVEDGVRARLRPAQPIEPSHSNNGNGIAHAAAAQ